MEASQEGLNSMVGHSVGRSVGQRVSQRVGHSVGWLASRLVGSDSHVMHLYFTGMTSSLTFVF